MQPLGMKHYFILGCIILMPQVATAHDIGKVPFFGSVMTGIYRPSVVSKTSLKQALASDVSCILPNCPQDTKPALSQRGGKLLP
jgi:hypothetical protein